MSRFEEINITSKTTYITCFHFQLLSALVLICQIYMWKVSFRCLKPFWRYSCCQGNNRPYSTRLMDALTRWNELFTGFIFKKRRNFDLSFDDGVKESLKSLPDILSVFIFTWWKNYKNVKELEILRCIFLPPGKYAHLAALFCPSFKKY